MVAVREAILKTISLLDHDSDRNTPAEVSFFLPPLLDAFTEFGGLADIGAACKTNKGLKRIWAKERDDEDVLMLAQS